MRAVHPLLSTEVVRAPNSRSTLAASVWAAVTPSLHNININNNDDQPMFQYIKESKLPLTKHTPEL